MKLDKITKKLGKDKITELDTCSHTSLQSQVVQAEQAMQQVRDELAANPNYQELKESLKALTAGKNEVNSRQKAIIAYCLYLLAKEN